MWGDSNEKTSGNICGNTSGNICVKPSKVKFLMNIGLVKLPVISAPALTLVHQKN